MAQFQEVMEVTSFSYIVIGEMDVIMVLVLGNMHHCCKLNVHTVVMMDPWCHKRAEISEEKH